MPPVRENVGEHDAASAYAELEQMTLEALIFQETRGTTRNGSVGACTGRPLRRHGRSPRRPSLLQRQPLDDGASSLGDRRRPSVEAENVAVNPVCAELG